MEADKLTVQKYEKLKQHVEEAKRRHDEAVGEYNANLKALKTEFGVSTVKEAERLLKTLREKEEKRLKLLERSIADFERKYHAQLTD